MSQNKVTNLLDAITKFGEGGGSGLTFFSLKQDRESAKVRFLHTDANSIPFAIIHEIKGAEDKFPQKVACLQDESCPGCKAGLKPMLRVYLQLVDSRDGQIKVWERSPGFAKKIVGLIERYGELNNRVYEIERFGKQGDNKTTYEMYAMDRDDKTSGLPERIEVTGKAYRKLSVQEMEQKLGTVSEQPQPTVEPRKSTGGLADIF